MTIHIVKLSVGTESVEDLARWQASRRASNKRDTGREEHFHTTRMVPKRQDEVLDGGSIYWVIKGVILARQRILRLDEVRGQDGILRCALVLDPDLRRTEPVPRRPFQGWRYLEPGETPRDLPKARANEPGLPPRLMAALAEIGVR